jgi:hypothetical protein
MPIYHKRIGTSLPLRGQFSQGKKKAATGRRRGRTNIFGGMGYVCRAAHSTKSSMSLEVININIFITKTDIEK